MTRSDVFDLIEAVHHYCDITAYIDPNADQVHGIIVSLIQYHKTIYGRRSAGFCPRFGIGVKRFEFNDYYAVIEEDPDSDGQNANHIIVTRHDRQGVKETKKFILDMDDAYSVVSFCLWVR